ncbi:MAG TPA: methyltransferase, partial [Novosphingobium sp.]|nr:methyltransferase [Novosphingobium sp.]
MRRLILPTLALALAVPALVAQPAPAKTYARKINADLAAAVANPLRDKDRPRDQYRRPAETLTFFQVLPDMKVGEYAPGGEWYSRLLGLYLGPKGRLVGLYFDPTSGAFSETTQKGIREGAAKYPADIAGWSGIPAERFAAYPLDAV